MDKDYEYSVAKDYKYEAPHDMMISIDIDAS